MLSAYEGYEQDSVVKASNKRKVKKANPRNV